MTSERLDNYQLQFDEIELLKSMYPEEGQVSCADLLHYCQLKAFVESDGAKDEITFNILRIDICLVVDGKYKLEINSDLPCNYPGSKLPNIAVRSNNLSRHEEVRLNQNVQNFMSKELDVGDLCLSQVCEWVCDNCEEYFLQTAAENNKKSLSSGIKKELNATEKLKIFSRFWIFSHHIYSKTKRKCILEWSKELSLKGFSLPGKPGVICAEGLQENCEEYWRRLRNMNWKRISLVDRFDKQLDESESLSSFCRFQHEEFEEKNFAVHGGRDYHMDLGMFFKFLQDHQLHQVFQILFGVEGKPPSELSKKT